MGWQVKSGTIFDNILITDDAAEAKKIGDELFKATSKAERKMKDAQDEEERKKKLKPRKMRRMTKMKTMKMRMTLNPVCLPPNPKAQNMMNCKFFAIPNTT